MDRPRGERGGVGLGSFMESRTGGGGGLGSCMESRTGGGGGLGSCMESRTGGGGWSWVFITMQDHTPPMGRGVQGVWDFARAYPPHGQYAAKNTSYNGKCRNFPNFGP